MAESKAKLSVVVFTYNLEKFVSKAIDSILDQKVNFKYKIMIFDGCSTDGTIKILQKYKDMHPNIIQLFLTTTYKSFLDVNIEAYKHLDTQYFTVLDGDDYWTCDTKLQKQIDFLDSNKDFVLCGHDTQVLYENDPSRKEYIFNGNKNHSEITFSEALNMPWYMHTSSTVFRNVIFSKGVPDMFINARNSSILSKVYSGDSIRNYMHAEKGKIKFIDECMSVYCVHKNATWSTLNEYERQLSYLFLLLEVNNFFKNKYRKLFYRTIMGGMGVLKSQCSYTPMAAEYASVFAKEFPKIFLLNFPFISWHQIKYAMLFYKKFISFKIKILFKLDKVLL